MKTTVINFKTEKSVKEKAQKVAKQIGLNLTDIMNVYLRDFINRKELNIRVEEPTEETAKDIMEAIKEIKEGKTSPTFDDAETAIKWLDEKSKKICRLIFLKSFARFMLKHLRRSGNHLKRNFLSLRRILPLFYLHN